MDASKVLIVVFHSRQEPWESIVREGQFKTWVSEGLERKLKIGYCFGPIPNRFVCFLDQEIEKLRWLRGGRIADFRNLVNKVLARPFRGIIPNLREVTNFEAPSGVVGLEARVWDLYATARWRQLALFKHFLKSTDCEYLVIVTSATYIVPELLLSTLENLDNEFLYAGPIHGEKPGQLFVSGAQLVVNRKFAEIALRDRRKIPTHVLNDLGLSQIATINGIELEDLPSINLGSISEVHNLSDEILKKNYHFRLKAFDQCTGERIDVRLFHALHARIKS
jgi:hypothetical protein